MTLIDFLLARVAEDEWWARQASAGNWRPWGQTVMTDIRMDGRDVADGIEVAETYFKGDRGEPKTWNSQHICRWEPSRALAECEAKRRIIAEHPHTFTEGDGRLISDAWECQRCNEPFWWCKTLRALVEPYAGHDDFLEEWHYPTDRAS